MVKGTEEGDVELTISDDRISGVLKGEQNTFIFDTENDTEVNVGETITITCDDGTYIKSGSVGKLVYCNAIEAYEMIQILGGKHPTESTDELMDDLAENGFSPSSTVEIIMTE